MKTIKVLVILCIILISALGIKIYISNKDANSYSKEDVINLLENGDKYNNYYCKYTLLGSDSEIIRYIKDGKQRIIGNDNMIYYIDKKENKKIILKPSTKTGVEMKLDSKASLKSIDSYLSDIITDIQEHSNSFKYYGKENINGLDCIVIEVTFDNFLYNSRKVWIDTKSGLVAKCELKYDADNKLFSIDYNLKLDSVADSDVEISNLNEFNITKLDE